MPSFLDFMLPQDTGLNAGQMSSLDRQGLLNMGAVLASMSAPHQGGTKATPMELIANGMLAYQQGANNGLAQFYQNKSYQTNEALDKAKVANAAVQEAMDRQNLDWFNNLQNPYPKTSKQPGKAPQLKDFYTTDPLTLAQIQQESGGNPNAVSPKGAAGLMQVMPDTGVNPGFGVKPLQNNTPQENVRFGEDYRNALIQKYGGNEALAMIAYNWGPGNTDNWLNSGADPAKLPEETRNYVQTVLTNAQRPVTQMGGGNPERAAQLYQLAEMQMRAGRPGADSVMRVAAMYDPALAKINNQSSPAAIQIADELQKARAAGDTQRVNDLVAVTKMYDKGYMPDGNGGVTAIPGYGPTTRQLSYDKSAGAEEGKTDVTRMQDQAKIVAKMPLLETDLQTYKQKLDNIDPALLGPIRGKASYYLSAEVQDLTSTARSIALQLKDIYNLGSGQGFTDTDRDYLDSIIGGAKVDPLAAAPILEDMYRRIQLQKDVYKQTADFYKQNNSLHGFVPTTGTSSPQFNTTPSGVKYRIVQ